MSGRSQGSVARANGQQTAVPPFPANAADNGLSVDPVTKHIVLGNDVAAITAALLSNREIPLAGFNIEFTDVNSRNQISPGGIQTLDTLNLTQVQIDNIGQVDIQGNSAIIGNRTPVILWQDLAGGISYAARNTTGEFRIDHPAILASRMLSLDSGTGIYQLGDIDGLGNFTELNIDDANQTIQLRATGLMLTVDFLNRQYQMGDIGNFGNGVKFVIDDIADTITSILNGLYAIQDFAGNNYFFINQGGGSASWGDIAGVSTTSFFSVNFGVGYTSSTSPLGFGVNQVPAASPFCVAGLAAFANNAAAVAGGLVPGDFYRISAAGTSTVAVVE